MNRKTRCAIVGLGSRSEMFATAMLKHCDSNQVRIDHVVTAALSGEPHKKRVKAVEKMRPVAERNRKTLAQLAINWNLRRPGVTTALVGARSPAQVKATPEHPGGSLSVRAWRR